MTGIIRMPRPDEIHAVPVIPAALIGVADQDTDGLTGGSSIEHTGEEFRGVRFLAGGGQKALTGGTAGHFGHQARHINLHARRKAIHDHADRLCMALPEDGQLQLLPIGAAHSAFPPSSLYTFTNSGQDLFSACTPVTTTGSFATLAAAAPSMTMR